MALSQITSLRPTSLDLAETEAGARTLDSTPASIVVRGFMDPATLDAQTAFYVRFLDVLHATEAIQASHRRTVESLDLREGYHLLDVGCGTGNFARDVAPLVGSTGSVVGIDLSPALLGVARQRATGLDLPLTFDVADAQHLPFADNTFDGCHVERVLQYLAAPCRALAEMARVTKPGGRIAAAEVDWDTIINDLPGVERDVYRRLNRAMSDSAGNGWMGRQLRRRLLDLGLEDVTCEGFVVVLTDAAMALDDIGSRRSIARVRDAGAISAAEYDRLIAAMEHAGTLGRYFAAFTLFLVSGRKPAT